MSGISYSMPRFQAIDMLGRPMVGATLYTYQTKTTTPAPTGRDKGQAAYNTNPVVLDARGEAVIWLDPAQTYTFVLRDWLGSVVWTQDDITGAASGQDLQALIDRLADASDPDNGAGMVGYEDGTVADKLDFFVNFYQKAAIPSYAEPEDPDSTAMLQSMIDGFTGAVEFDGRGQQWNVKSLHFKSDTALVDVSFRAVGGDEDFVAPVTVDGRDGNIVRNLHFEGVHIDGNRTEQLNVGNSPPVAENGGRHGFRILGQVHGVRMVNCSARYCATHGLSVFNGAQELKAAFQDWYLSGCVFDWNGGHGAAWDSIYGLRIIGALCRNNGRIMPGFESANISHGGRHRPFDPSQDQLYPFSNGMDFEGYGPNSRLYDIELIGCSMEGNAWEGVAFRDSSGNLEPNFLAWQNIRIIGGSYDEGFGDESRKAGIAFISHALKNQINFRQIHVAGAHCIGRPIFENCADFSFVGGSITPLDNQAERVYADNAYGYVNCMAPATKQISRLLSGSVVKSYFTNRPPVNDFTPNVIWDAGADVTVQNVTNSFVNMVDDGVLTYITEFDAICNSTGAAYLRIIPAAGSALVGATASATDDAGVNIVTCQHLQGTPFVMLATTATETEKVKVAIQVKVSDLQV
ncbi:MAG: hypothetical protein QNL48_16190 [Alcaligenes aquatilis]